MHCTSIQAQTPFLSKQPKQIDTSTKKTDLLALGILSALSTCSLALGVIYDAKAVIFTGSVGVVLSVTWAGCVCARRVFGHRSKVTPYPPSLV